MVNHYYLSQIKERYPMVMHGVSLSIGSQDPLNWDYLKQVKNLAQQINAVWISDHLLLRQHKDRLRKSKFAQQKYKIQQI